MLNANKNDLVQVHIVVLNPESRPKTLPESTRAVPYEAWIKGFLVDEEASVGDEVRVRTFIGRELTGTLAVVQPTYTHNFGIPRPELLPIGGELFARLDREGGESK